jgi:virulence factor Mce-like protein
MKRQHLISLAGVVAVLLACTAYLAGNVLGIPLTSQPQIVHVDMPRTGGLFSGSNASYRGIVVGKVTDMTLTDTGVEATVRLDAGTKIPAATKVRVRSLSPIGEQYLDFQPTTDDGRYLHTGDRLTANPADLPRTVADLAISLDRLMGQADPTDLHVVLSQLSTGLGGAEQDLQSLVRDSLTLVDTFDTNSGVLVDFLRQNKRLLKVGADNGPTITRATRSYATFAAWLDGYQPELYATLAKAPDQMEQLRQLIADLRAELPGFLDAQGSLSAILNARSPHLRALLQDFPLALEALARPMEHGRFNFDVLARNGPQCDYVNVERDPRATSWRDLQDQGHCPTTVQSYSQRGAQFAPPPVS